MEAASTDDRADRAYRRPSVKTERMALIVYATCSGTVDCANPTNCVCPVCSTAPNCGGP